MADEALEAGEAPKKSKMKWIILAVLLILLGVGGYFGYTMFVAKDDPAAATEQAGADDEMAEEDPLTEQVEGLIVSLPPFLVNLADPLGRRYLKLALDVEVRDEQSKMDLEKKTPQIRDTMLLLLSSKTFEQLATLKDKIELKQDIVRRLNQIVGRNKVLRVYITEMVVQ
ncbi:MAG: flagellar basal body-associated FliL family protein [Desulfovibrio sp.]